MVILEEPYVSNGLLQYLKDSRIPVLKNRFSEKINSNGGCLNLVEDFDFIGGYHHSKKIYTVSEHALAWIESVLHDRELSRQIALLKNKTAFRNACSHLYPDFFFQELSYTELFTFDLSDLHFPFILKPSVGFLSSGVYAVYNEADWEAALVDIRENFNVRAEKFPDTVVRNDIFILESYIKGKEFAVDLYFRGREPVIINIFEHPFSSEKDVSDRLYVTSKEIFRQYLAPFSEFMSRLNDVLHLEHIPVHLELRVDGDMIIPIEINPLRFAGMCLNEISYYVTGKHPLHYFFNNTVPDYAAIWEGKENDSYCFSILEKPESSENSIWDINVFMKVYSDILEVRPIENPDLGIQAFVFSKTSKKSELKNILEMKM